MLEWERNIERARAGEPVDFDGDGFAEYLQWEENSVLYVEIKSPDGDFSWVSERHPDGTKTILYDADGDGKTDERIEEKPSSQIYYISSNGDGIFDERISITFDFENNAFSRIFEKLANGTWKETRKETDSISRSTTLPTESEVDLQGFVKAQYVPQVTIQAAIAHKREDGANYEDIGNKITVKTDGKTGTCSKAQVERIQNTFNNIYSAKSKALECIDQTNPDIGARLRDIKPKFSLTWIVVSLEKVVMH